VQERRGQHRQQRGLQRSFRGAQDEGEAEAELECAQVVEQVLVVGSEKGNVGGEPARRQKAQAPTTR
jgi:hypothetical protein